MRTYERSGVVIDRCTECGGIFLDRGELERLTDAEAAYAGPSRYDESGTDDRDREREYQRDPREGRGRRRRGGFLGDLLDFGD